MNSKLDDLKSQLSNKGIDAPESVQHCGLTELDSKFVDMVQGGQIVEHGTHVQGTTTGGGSSSSSSSKPKQE
jgi:altronate dehydratase